MAEAPRTPLGGLPAMPQSSDLMDTDTDLEFYGVPTFSASPGNLKDAASAGRAAKPRGADRRAAPSVLARTRQLPPRSPARQLARSPRLRSTLLYRSEPDGAECKNVHLVGHVLDEVAAAAAAPLLPPLGGRIHFLEKGAAGFGNTAPYHLGSRDSSRAACFCACDPSALARARTAAPARSASLTVCLPQCWHRPRQVHDQGLSAAVELALRDRGREEPHRQEGQGRSARRPVRKVTDEKHLRRLFFITYGKEVSAEQHAWFGEKQFVRACEELTAQKQQQSPEKKAKKA